MFSSLFMGIQFLLSEKFSETYKYAITLYKAKSKVALSAIILQ